MTDLPGEPPASPAPEDPPPLDAPPLPDPAVEAPPPPPDLRPRPFRFTGSGSEYFRIWIVNLLLSLLTLGIYSAWAKVRRLRYFYGHTAVDGGRFGYHASPIAILKGRLIAYGVVVLLAVVGNLAPVVASILYLPLLVLMPIVFVRAFRFRAANSSYRGIRFSFEGMEHDAYRVYLLLPLLVPFTLGLIYPFVVARQREFHADNSRLGRSPFRLAVPTLAVYRIYAVAALAGLAWFGVALFLAASAMVAAGGDRDNPVVGGGVAMAVLVAYAGLGVLYVGVRTAFENLVWNHTTLDAHRFDSRLRIPHMLAIYVVNLVTIAATLGLAVPWARVRLARYRADSLTLLPGGPLSTEADTSIDRESATGAELSEAMDFDIGL
ncbi:MAG: YjgN family protein [Vicinamibacterales bacterium]